MPAAARSSAGPARKKVSNLRLEEPALRTRIASATPDS